MDKNPSCANTVNQERLVSEFLKLVQVNGPSGNEKGIADFVEHQLLDMGFSVEYDEAHQQTGGNCGNLFAVWNGFDSGIPPLLFSTHLDTVLPTKDLKPNIREGNIYSDGTTILGADDRAALAAYLEAIRVIQTSQTTCGPIEFIFTISEQTALLGSRNLDYSKVRSKSGYIFDSSGDVGQIILGGPYGRYIYWNVEGKPAHLGLAASEGISAIVIAADAISQMKLGQVDESTVANIGVIKGGELGSIIPRHVEMTGEVRSYSLAGLEKQIQQMCSTVDQAARKYGGTARVQLENKYVGYDIAIEDQEAQIAIQAANRLGIKPFFVKTLGGADTNNFREHGINVMTLGNGFSEIHSFNEHISIQNLVDTARLSVGLIEEYTSTYLERSRS